MNNVVIADFDETITSRDTIDILGRLPYTLNPEFKPPWSHFVDVYCKHYERFQLNNNRRVLPLLPLGKKTIITDSNFTQLFHAELEYQSDKRLLEFASTTEIQSRNVFKKIKHEDIRSYVENNFQGAASLLRPGFSNFISSLPKDNFYVISVNWSPEFIRYVIGSKNVDLNHITCNNLISHGDEYTGHFTNDMLTGSDKIRALQQILSYYDNKKENHCLWYVGDSDTDLLSVLFPNVNGVLLIDPVKEPKKFEKITVKLLGLPKKDMDEFAHDSSLRQYVCCTKQGGKNVYIVKSWNDLQKLVFGENRSAH